MISPPVRAGVLLTFRTFIIFTACVFAFLTTYFQAGSSSWWSRISAGKALVERGTWSIDAEPWTPVSVDKILVRGKFYSDKPPTMALLVAAIYYPLYHLGFHLQMGWSPVYALITFILIGGSTLACLWAFYRALEYAGASQSSRLIMTAALAFATLMLPWSTTFNNHSFAGAWIFIAFYLLLRSNAGPGYDALKDCLMAGAAIGLAAAADSACTLFVGGFAVYIVLSKRLRRGLLAYLAAAVLVMLPGIIISRMIAGDFRPLILHSEFFHYPGSFWNTSKDELTGIKINDPAFACKYALLCLMGPNGFLLYDPLLFIALYYAIRLAVRGGPFWKEAALVLLLSGTFMGYFFLNSTNFSGHSYSIRWFVTLIPLLWFFAFPFFSNRTRTKMWCFSALAFVAFLIAVVGVFGQWPPTLLYPGRTAIAINWKDQIKPTIHHIIDAVKK